ncbi:MAG: histidine phosphatase family protein [Clostridia bacterium]|nr:histidine phosphatase family protein [Clostridia bacterium]
MIFYYVRHGDPIYNPDSLTPLGHRQAEAVGRRLSQHGLDKIFASTSNRAILTATPTAEMLKKEITTLEFANENLAWAELTVERNGKKTWIFGDDQIRKLFSDPSVLSLGFDWFTHPELAPYEKGIKRVQNEVNGFFKALGYEHIQNTGTYKVLASNNERVAMFAHQGFGIAFLSAVLDIPYPLVAMHMDMSHSDVTVIEFAEKDGIAVPKMLMLSNDSHLYKEGLPTKYNNSMYL